MRHTKVPKHGACRVHNETTCHKLTWIGAITHVVDHAPNKTWIHVYNISLEYIPTLQDQEASMIREGLPPNHERPSFEVHDTLINLQGMHNISSHKVEM